MPDHTSPPRPVEARASAAIVGRDGDWKRAADVVPGDVQFFAGEWLRVVKVEPIWRTKVRIHHDDLTWREWTNDCRLLIGPSGSGSEDER